MKALIDGDIILYEIGFAAEAAWKHIQAESRDDSGDPPPWNFVEEILENRLANIKAVAGATMGEIYYFTGSSNFRTSIARTAPYKERPGNKPFHYYNVRAFLHGTRDCITVEGLEADDCLAIEATRNPETTIICSRDKDLRQVVANHYSWELGNQPQFGPMKVEGFGELMLSSDGKKVIGWGDKFFYFQLLTGDPVDTIPGIPKMGPKTALKLLQRVQTHEEALDVCKEQYKRAYGLYWPEVMLEQGQLLWIVRELDAEGNPIMWRF